MTESTSDHDAHLSAQDVASWVDRTASPDERRAMAAHLAVCPTCREDVVGTQRALRDLRPSRLRWMMAGFLPLAAVLVLVFLPTGADTPAGVSLRSGPTPEGVQSIEVVAPRPGQRVPSGGKIVFRWRSVGEKPGYRLFLTRESGDVIWEQDVTRTEAALPDSLSPLTAGRYFWWVDALLQGGETATSGIHEFLLDPP